MKKEVSLRYEEKICSLKYSKKICRYGKVKFPVMKKEVSLR